MISLTLTHRLRTVLIFATCSLLSALPAPAASGATVAPSAATPLTELAFKALWNYPESAEVAIKALRAAGPSGIEVLLAADRTRGDRTIGDAEFGRVLDRVCAQRDCAGSHLYWYTDLDAARAAALAAAKPILSLRLLGRLDEEFSCANSRFFRTVLYADPEISRALRERYILHWQSVRPVPRITIDMGDGRSLTGTITGNSIHYALDSRGRLLDALPGLIGPQAFLRHLNDLDRVAREVTGLDHETFARGSAERHAEQALRLSGMLSADLDRYQKWLAAPARNRTGKNARVEPAMMAGDPPTAVEASRLAMTKSGVEIRLLNVLFPPSPGERWGDGIPWVGVANYHREDWQLDPAARERLRRKMGLGAGPEAERMAANFESLLSLDTVRNELGLHAVLHDWLAAEEYETIDLDAFNERVYADLFLTPNSDPWLGLNPDDVFTGLSAQGAADRER